MTETQFVLRLPDKLAKELRALMNKQNADPSLDAKAKAQPCFKIKPHDKDKLVDAYNIVVVTFGANALVYFVDLPHDKDKLVDAYNIVVVTLGANTLV